MFDTVLETIKRLENRETLTKEDEELLEYLHSEAMKEINLNLLNLMSYGSRLGWDKIEQKLLELLAFIRKSRDLSSQSK